MEDNRFFEFLTKHWSKLLLSVLTVITAAAWGQRLLRSSQHEKDQDFVVANHIYERFLKGEYLPSESIETTQNILKRHPELKPKYDLLLALTFFSQHNLSDGCHYARELVEHAGSKLPDVYKEYAQTTLLISEERYHEALTAARVLDKTLEAHKDYPNLEAMNCLRILSLSKQLGDSSVSETYLKKLKKNPAFPALSALFKEGNLSLEDYFGL